MRTFLMMLAAVLTLGFVQLGGAIKADAHPHHTAKSHSTKSYAKTSSRKDAATKRRSSSKKRYTNSRYVTRGAAKSRHAKKSYAPKTRYSKGTTGKKRYAKSRSSKKYAKSRMIPVRAYKIVRRSKGTVMQGVASYYWQPQPVASGGRFNPQALTAAHRTLPFGTRIRVTNKSNGKSVVVKINDRGPYIKGRNLDLSLRAATVIGMRKAGVVPVTMEVL